MALTHLAAILPAMSLDDLAKGKPNFNFWPFMENIKNFVEGSQSLFLWGLVIALMLSLVGIGIAGIIKSEKGSQITLKVSLIVLACSAGLGTVYGSVYWSFDKGTQINWTDTAKDSNDTVTAESN